MGIYKKISFTKYNHIIMYSSQVLTNAALARSYVAPLPTVAPTVVAPTTTTVAPLATTTALRRSTLGLAGYPYAGLGYAGLGYGGLYGGLYNGLGYAGLGYGGLYGGLYGGRYGLNGLGLAGYPYTGLGNVALNNALRRSQTLLGASVAKVVV